MPKFIFAWLIFHSSLVNNKSSYLYVIFWNTGQGQWITAVTPDECAHLDFGGETRFFRKNQNLLLQICKNKQNSLRLSHPDLDHYAFYKMFIRQLKSLCWPEPDHTAIPEHHLFKKLPLCVKNFNQGIQRIFNPSTSVGNKNDRSKIYQLQNILIPGDSSKKMEKVWSSLVKNKKIHYLLLGHHGSRTSTSDKLLENLSQLKMAIVQSRAAKFNHPHREVIQRLQKRKIALIKTEDWGNLAIIFY